jgi:serine protease AprX
VTVAVIDTGVDYTHPDLADRVVESVNFEPGWFFDMINDGLYSDRLAEATGSPIDTYGHGTFVAGVVAGTGGAGAGADFSGVAPGASLVNLKIADVHEGLVCDVPCDFGWEINALVAYEWMIENRNDPAFPGGIRVASNSWSIFEVDSEVEPITLIVKAAAERGIVNVFAAGNDGPDPNTVAPGPNSLEEVITVAAACKTAGYQETERCRRGQIASFSSRGPQVDVVAPGVSIYSAMAHVSVLGPISDHTPPPGPSDPAAFAGNAASYFGADGTSAAAPHVSGIVALLLEANPRLTPAEVEGILVATAVDRGNRGFDTSWGFGLVNAHRAVAMAETRAAARGRTHH